MNKVKVSVLIPVYNMQDYIAQCATSLFEQTMTDGIEYIFVDDASTDSGIDVVRDLLEEYPHRKNQVRIVRHPQNRGISCVRQTALAEANGDYFIFCDSDDYVEPDMYERMYLAAVRENADIVGCSYFDEYPDAVTTVNLDYSLSPQETIQAMLSNKPYQKGYLWCRMFRRAFFAHYKINFIPGLAMLEDLAVVIPAYYHNPKGASVLAPLYHYRRRSSSLSGHFSTQSVASAITAMDHLRPFCDTPETKQAWNQALAMHAQPLVTQLHTYNPSLWRKTTKGIPLKYFGSFLGKLSPMLIRLHLDKLNYLLLKLYRTPQ